MRTLFNLIRGEIKRVLADQLAHPGDSLSWVAYTSLMFFAVVVILSGVTGTTYDNTARLAVLVGWLTFQVAATCMINLPDDIEDEAETGTLEQLTISPAPLILIFIARSVAYFLSTGALGLATGILLLLLMVHNLPAGDGVAFGLVFLISLIGAYGFGFMMAGLTLVAKQISAVTGIVFSLMIFLTGSFVSLEALGGFYEVTRLLFPLTWGISLLRGILTGMDLLSLLQSGELLGLLGHAFVYLLVGLAVFSWGYRKARLNGTLGHY